MSWLAQDPYALGWLAGWWVVTDEVTSNIIIFCEDGEQSIASSPRLSPSLSIELSFFSKNNGAAISQMPDL
jgi:hypothetical protein